MQSVPSVPRLRATRPDGSRPLTRQTYWFIKVHVHTYALSRYSATGRHAKDIMGGYFLNRFPLPKEMFNRLAGCHCPCGSSFQIAACSRLQSPAYWRWIAPSACPPESDDNEAASFKSLTQGLFIVEIISASSGFDAVEIRESDLYFLLWQLSRGSDLSIFANIEDACYRN